MLKITMKEKPMFKKKRVNYARRLKARKLVNYLQRELRSSTTHGLPYIANAEIHWFERIFWAISFLTSCAITFVLLVSQYTRLVEAPIVMSVEKDYLSWNVSYPTVMLCPVNKINEAVLADYINSTLNSTGENLEGYYRSIASVSLESLNVLDLPSPETLKLIDPKEYAQIAMSLFKSFDNSSMTTHLKWPLRVEASMSEMGMCHVLNSNVAIFDDPMKWDQNIAYTKTDLELSVHDIDYYIQILNYATAFKIYTLSPDDVLLSGSPVLTFDIEGSLSFGVQITSTRASLDINEVPLHYRKCRFIHESVSQRYPVYSYNRCIMECRIKMILKLCDCIPHFYKPLDNERVCNLAELECVLEYRKEILTLSTSNETMTKVKNSDGLPKSFRDCGCLGNCVGDVFKNDRESYLPQQKLNRLRVTVSAFPKVRVKREIIFSFYDLFLRSGGVVNLCIGTSVISIMELLMIALRIPVYEIMQMVKAIWRRYKISLRTTQAPTKLALKKKQI